MTTPAKRSFIISFTVLFATSFAYGDIIVTQNAPQMAETRHVVIGGGGTVTYLAQSPSDPNVKYLVADVAGLHRWNPDDQSWTPLHDHYGPDNVRIYHGELAAVHPNDPETVVYSAGTQWATGPYALYRSTDGGKTWSDPIVLRDLEGKPIFITNGGTGHRLVFDPHNGNVLYYGSRRDGLYRSDDAGKSFVPVETLPQKNAAINFVQFDPTTGQAGQGSRVIYVGVSKAAPDGADVAAAIYRSSDGGRTFQKFLEPPTSNTWGTVDSQGNLYLHRGRVYRLAKTDIDAGRLEPHDITPPLARHRSVWPISVDPGNPDRIVAGTINGGDVAGLFYSHDAGKTWRSFVNQRLGVSGDLFRLEGMQPYDPDFGWIFACMHQAAFDTADPRRVFFTGWYTISCIDDVDAPVPTIRQLYRGIEMTCIWDLICPPRGAPLISGLMDLGGFVHEDVDQLPGSYLKGMGIFGNPNDHPQDVTDLDFCVADPQFVVATIGWRDSGDKGSAGFSRDGGARWQTFPSKPFPDAKNGRIAVSALDPNVIVWIPRSPSEVYVTRDCGRTWTAARGAPKDIVFGDFVYSFYMPLASDRVDGSFYLYDRRTGDFYRSDDGSAFSVVSRLPTQSGIHTDLHHVKAAPGEAGRVFVALDDKGLFRSDNRGTSWQRLHGISIARALGFGLGPSGGQSVYIVGRLDCDPAVPEKRVAVYRSDDWGASWTRLTDPRRNGLASTVCIEGDQQTPGRAYVGDNGRGILRLDVPGTKTHRPTMPSNRK